MKIKHLTTLLIVFTAFVWSCSAPPKAPMTLKDALKGKFFIGAALNANQFWERDTADVNIIKQHFSAIVPENCMKSMYIQPKEGVFNFEDADQFVTFGEKNGMWITGHCLIWHSQLPAWFCVDETGINVSPEVMKVRMKSHISTLVGRFKGRIHGWDVVNEAFLDDGSYRKTPFYEILGEEYLPLAFQYAHEADPNVELYYNDYNEWHPGKREAIIRLIKTLKERGIRIDAIGMQAHIGMEGPSIAEYEEAIQDYINAGVKVMITEFDLSILPYPRSGISADVASSEEYRKEINPYTEGVPESVSLAWTNRMLDFFKLFQKYKDNVSRVTMWGVSDGVSWKNNFPVRGRTDYPLLFDRNHQPKPIVGEIIRLSNQKTDRPPVKWSWVGIGGGGSVFTPAVSPHDPNFAFTSCDMSGSMVTYNGGKSWRMFNLSSVVRYFVFDSNDPNVVYAHSIGLFKSEDKGQSWRLLIPNPAEVTGVISKFDHADEYFITHDHLRRSVRAFAVDPTQSKHLYAAIRVEQNIALYSSTDGGETWTKEKNFDHLSGYDIPFPLGRVVNDYEHDIKNIFVDPSSPPDRRTLYVTCRDGVFQRVDGQWKRYDTPDKDIKFNFYAGGYDAASKKFILYAISSRGYFNRMDNSQNGIFYSENGGRTWENRQDGLLKHCTPEWRTAEYRHIATSALNPGTLYISYNGLRIHPDTTCFGVAKSTDYGKTWTLPWQDKSSGGKNVNTPNFPGSWLDMRFGSGWASNPHHMAVSPTHPNVLYRTDFGRIIRTVNGGETWEETYSRQLPDGSWTTRGVEVTTNYAIAFDPFDKNNVFLMVTDIGLIRSKNGGKGWFSATQNNGVPRRWVNTAYWLVFDPEVKGRLWTVMSYNHDIPRSKMWANGGVDRYQGGVLVSNDSGDTWEVVSQSIGEAAMTHILLDPTSKKDSRTLYACAFGKGVYKSTDDGKTWVQKNTGIEGKEPFAWRIERRESDGTLFLIVSRRSDDGSIGDDRDGALYRSTDGAETWTKMTLPDGCNGPTDIVTSKKYPKRLVLSAWGRVMPGDLAPDEGGGIYISDNEGKTWKQVMGSDQHIYAVSFDPRNNRYYACGFNSAAYYSVDGAKTWTRIKGYDFKWGHRVIPDPYNPEMIYVATFGGGVWYGPAKGDPNATGDYVTATEQLSKAGERMYSGVDLKKIDALIKKTLNDDPSIYNTDWFGSMLIAGLLNWRDLGYPAVVDYATRWLNYHHESQKGISDDAFHARTSAGRTTVIRDYNTLLFGVYAGYFGVNFACSPLYKLTGNELARQVCKDAGDMVLKKIPRNEIGLLLDDDHGLDFTLPDAAYFFLPTLFSAARAYDKEVQAGDIQAKKTQDQLIAFGYDQLKRFIDLFLDKEKKIAKTIYMKGKLGETYWTRANGWLLWTIVESIEHLDKDSELFRFACNALEIMAQGIANYQHESGALHLYVDEPDSPLETTGTIFTAYGIHKAVRMGWIDKKYLPIAIKAWDYVNSMVDSEGNISGCYSGWALTAEHRSKPTFGYLKFMPGMLLTTSAEFEKSK